MVNVPCIAVHVYKNGLNNFGPEFVDVVEQMCKDEWSPLSWDLSYTGHGVVSEYRTSRSCELAGIRQPCIESEGSTIFNNHILPAISTCLADYTRVHQLPESYKDEDYRLLRYEGSAEYRTHHDHAADNSRMISIVAYPKIDGIGGELDFPFFKTTIYPESNDVVIFPSNFPYAHTARPMSKGVKYSLVTWLR